MESEAIAHSTQTRDARPHSIDAAHKSQADRAKIRTVPVSDTVQVAELK
jgi:hypothetical protein